MLGNEAGLETEREMGPGTEGRGARLRSSDPSLRQWGAMEGL